MTASKIKDNTYITIQSFMVNELGLKGNNLLIYAIIYGFSQDNQGKFTGSLQYLADWTNSTKHGVMKNLKSLIDKGLIIKEESIENNIKKCCYFVSDLDEIQEPKQAKDYVTKDNGVCNKVTRGMQQSYTNNIEDNIENTYIYLGEYKHVKLSKDEYQKLQSEYDNYNELITYLDEYIERKSDYRSNNNYLDIKNWVVVAVKDRNDKLNRKTYVRKQELNEKIVTNDKVNNSNEELIKMLKEGVKNK